jgi:hypothetical protein
MLPLSSFAYGQSPSGAIRGITRDLDGLLAHVQVVVHAVNGNTERTVVSNHEGAFVVENLKPGPYQLTATKEGFEGRSETTVDLAAHQTLWVDMTLVSPNRSKGSSNLAPSGRSQNPPAPEDSENPPLTDREKQLLDRLNRLEQRLAAMEAKEDDRASQTPAPTQSLLASLNAGAGLTPVEKPAALSVMPTAGKPAAAKPSATAPAGTASESASTQTKPEIPVKPQPFAFADWTWLNGTPRAKDLPFDTKFFTPEVRADSVYVQNFNHPSDDSMGGSSELFRSQEFQVTQFGVGGDFHWNNVRGRLMTQFGMYSFTTPRNDASPARGQWSLDTPYRYISEAYGGYHFNVMYGINVDAGIFLSYIGLCSYYNFDNWAYQPSYVSSNTPWFFNGVRIQIFPTEKLKIEPWIINGWQSYGRFNFRPGFGLQVLYRPRSWISIVGNQYLLGEDTLGNPGRVRYHTDDSIQIKYYDKPESLLDRGAFSFTGDLGCETGGGVSCDTNTAKGPKQSFLGYMFYNRLWFHKDLFGLTLGGGQINNPGRYLVLIPPINGATAITGTPYFTENPGDPFKAWDASVSFDYMPSQYVTFRSEFDHRHASVPYWSGPGGVTPPGGNNGNPAVPVPGWAPDLRHTENFLDFSILVYF